MSFPIGNSKLLDEKDDKIDRLKAELSDKTTMLETQFKAADIADSEITRLRSQLFQTEKNHATLGEQMREKDTEIEVLKSRIKAAFFRGSTCALSYHGEAMPFYLIEEAFSEFELEQHDNL
jgi:predicted RNase H-like nuclease (RuvC/YqgF family)